MSVNKVEIAQLSNYTSQRKMQRDIRTSIINSALKFGDLSSIKFKPLPDQESYFICIRSYYNKEDWNHKKQYELVGVCTKSSQNPLIGNLHKLYGSNDDIHIDMKNFKIGEFNTVTAKQIKNNTAGWLTLRGGKLTTIEIYNSYP